MKFLFLFVNLPNLQIGGNLYSDLVNEFINNGHDIYAASIGENTITEVCNENGAKVLRFYSIKTTYLSGVKKALTYQYIAYKLAKLIPKYFKNVKFDAIISHTLPPEIGLTLWWLKRDFHCLHYLIVSDFLWQDGVSLGIFGEKNPICIYYKIIEHIMFKNADLFSTPSRATIDFSKKYYLNFDESKCQIVRWWQNVPKINVDKKAVREQYGLGDKFVVIYGGSIGLMQRGNYLLDLAYSVRDYENILFLLFGKGDYLEEIKLQVDDLGLHNIKYQEFIPQQEYNKLLSVCDVGMIILNEKVGTPNIPSKTVSYYCYGIPILASVDKITDLGNLLATDGTGLCSLSGDNETFKSNLLKMYSDKNLLKRMSDNEQRIYSECMTAESAYHAIVEQIKSYKHV